MDLTMCNDNFDNWTPGATPTSQIRSGGYKWLGMAASPAGLTHSLCFKNGPEQRFPDSTSFCDLPFRLQPLGRKPATLLDRNGTDDDLVDLQEPTNITPQVVGEQGRRDQPWNDQLNRLDGGSLEGCGAEGVQDGSFIVGGGTRVFWNWWSPANVYHHDEQHKARVAVIHHYYAGSLPRFPSAL